MSGGLVLGTSVDLEKGLLWQWKPNPALPPFTKASSPSVKLNPTSFPTSTSEEWEFDLTICPTPEKLLDKLFDCHVLHVGRDAVGKLSASGGLLASEPGRTETLTQVGSFIGIDLLKATGGFAFVSLTCKFATLEHPILTTTSPLNTFLEISCLQDVIKLPTVYSKEGEEGLRSFMVKYGSYFLASVTVGHQIYQVFSYDSEIWDKYIKDVKLQGYNQKYFSRFTELAIHYSPTDRVGFARQIGKLLCTSDNPLWQSSLSANQWQEPVYVRGNSIFQYWDSEVIYPGVLVGMQAKVAPVPIGVGFANMRAFLTIGQKELWSRTLKLSLLARFSGLVEPNIVPVVVPSDVNESFPIPSVEYQAPISSYIATSRVDLYHERIDLATFDATVNQQGVKSFLLLANVVTVPFGKPYPIPGAQVIIIAQYLVALASGNNVPEITVSETAFDTGHFFFRSVIGTLKVSTPSGRRMLIGAPLVAYAATQQSAAVVPRYLPQAFSNDLLDAAPVGTLTVGARLAAVMNLSLAQMSWVLTRSTISTAATGLVENYFKWIMDMIGTYSHTELQNSRKRMAEMQLQLHLNPQFMKRHVPPLKYSAYTELVHSLESVAEAYRKEVVITQEQMAKQKQRELSIDIGNALNKNIIESGKLLLKFVQANAAKEGDIAKKYEDLIERNQADLLKVEKQVSEISELIETQRKVVKEKEADFKQAMTDWYANMIIKTIFDVTTSVLSVGLAFATPAASFKAFEGIGNLANTLQQIARIAQILKSLNDLRGAFANNLPGLLNADTINLLQEDLSEATSSSINWLGFRADMDRAFHSAPAEVLQKVPIKIEVGLLISYGEKWMATIEKQEKLKREIDDFTVEKAIAGNQEARLKEAAEALRLAELGQVAELSKVDLMGMASEMSFHYSRACSQLAGVIHVQRQALKYELLAESKELPNLDGIELPSLLSMVAGLNRLRVKLLENFPDVKSWVDPITVTVPVPRSAFLEGTESTFTIDLDMPDFINFIMVRLKKVVVSVKRGDLKKADDIKDRTYHLVLSYSGQPMLDRGHGRHILSFATAPRKESFLFNVDTGAAVLEDGGGPAEDLRALITPFSKWGVTLPRNRINEGLEATGDDIELIFEFHGAAILDVAPNNFTRAATDPEQTLINTMYTSVAMKKWDAVVAMDITKVNEILLAQYTDPTNLNIPKDPISGEKLIKNPQGRPQVRLDVSFALNALKIVFRSNMQDTLAVEAKIISGYVKKENYGKVVIGGQEHWVWMEEINENLAGRNYTISANIEARNLKLMLRRNSGSHDIILDLNDGRWAITGGQSSLGVIVDGVITDALKGKKYQYVLNTISTSTVADPQTHPSLVPNYIDLHCKKAGGREVILLYICSNGLVPTDPAFGITEPLLPNRTVVVYINHKTLYRHVLLPGFTDTGVDMALVDTDVHNFSYLNLQSYSWYLRLPAKIEMQNGKPYYHSLAGAKVQRKIDTGTGNKSLYPAFQFDRQQTTLDVSVQSGLIWTSHTFKIWISFSVPLPLKLQPNDESTMDFSVDTTSITPVVTAEPVADPNCPTDFNPSTSAFRESIVTQIETNLKQFLNLSFGTVKFPSVSILLLKSILFPAQYMNLNQVYMPGDLVMLGSLDSKKKKP